MIIKILPIQTGSAGKVEVTEGGLAPSEEIKKKSYSSPCSPCGTEFYV